MTETSSNGLFANLNAGAVPDPESPEDTSMVLATSELDMLKTRARIMGITFSNAIKLETLKSKIQAKLDAEEGSSEVSEDDEDEENEVEDEVVEDEKPEPAPDTMKTSRAEKPLTASKKLTLREQIVAKEMALVRCRITNMDPKKKDLPGEIFTVANEYLGTVRKFVPYGEVTDDGYHLPHCIYAQLIERTFVSIRTVKNKNGRGTATTTSDAREFSIDVLPPLTTDELARLANAQAAAAGN